MDGGVNFCVLSRYAERMQLLLFECEDSPDPYEVIQLDPRINRTFFFWHVFVENLPEGAFYNWRAEGRADTRETGSRLDVEKALLDPWATTISDRLWDRAAASRPGDNVETAIRGRVVRDDYDWEDDRPLFIPLNEAVIYEMHVGGFTRHPSSGVAHPGTFAGIVEKIPYLKELGITHVELMPVMAFDAQDVPPKTASLGLENYWGYSTHSFFAPHPGFAVSAAQARDEFRDMIKAFHRAGIGVILDVVFNHTAEGGESGPVISFKAFGNEIFYHLDFEDRTKYRDYTGCGNTMNCNHPLVTRFLIDALLYWVRRMHVDGFRFDLASALARGEDGKPQYHAPVLWSIELSPSLNRAHIIAEAWDAAGLYQVGDFPGYRWAEWNGRYRDVIRSFVRGDPGMVPEVATRLAGSSDMYAGRGRLPVNSINFVTCHDGFTLCDLVSYDHKHNEANGEDNRDGHDHNLSWNCGHEGPTDDPEIQRLRRRQARNFISILMLSQGVPMLLSGDEVFRTKLGNNNTYCQNNALSWSDWGLVDAESRHAGVRARHDRAAPTPSGADARPLSDRTARVRSRRSPISPGMVPGSTAPDWDDPTSRVLAFTLAGKVEDEPALHVMFNMDSVEHRLRAARHRGRVLVSLGRYPCPKGGLVVPPETQRPLTQSIGSQVGAHGVVVLESRPA
jgi:isoamylase